MKLFYIHLSYLVIIAITLLSKNQYSKRLSPKVTQLNSDSDCLRAHAFPTMTHSLASAPLTVPTILKVLRLYGVSVRGVIPSMPYGFGGWNHDLEYQKMSPLRPMTVYL